LTELVVLGGKYDPETLAGQARLAKSRIPELAADLPRTFSDLQVHGKFSTLILTRPEKEPLALWITFGMDGSLQVGQNPEEPGPGPTNHRHLKLVLTKDTQTYTAYFRDTRRFGNLRMSTIPELHTKLRTLGPDLLGATPEDVLRVASQAKEIKDRPITLLLMDQSIMAGIGNYLKTEALYRAQIHPLATTTYLRLSELVEVFTWAQQIAHQAYQARGASLYTFQGGQYQEFMEIYNKSKDSLGRNIYRINTPDKRTTCWVPEVQVKGLSLPSPSPQTLALTQPLPKIQIKLRPIFRMS